MFCFNLSERSVYRRSVIFCFFQLLLNDYDKYCSGFRQTKCLRPAFSRAALQSYLLVVLRLGSNSIAHGFCCIFLIPHLWNCGCIWVPFICFSIYRPPSSIVVFLAGSSNLFFTEALMRRIYNLYSTFGLRSHPVQEFGLRSLRRLARRKVLAQKLFM